MSSGERTEWPTRSWLDDLREQGVVSVSRVSLRCVAAAFGIVAIFAVMERMRRVASSFESQTQRVIAADSSTIMFQAIGEVVGGLWPVFVAPVAAVIFSTLLAGLFQTRFLLRMASLSFDPSRLALSRASLIRGMFHRFFTAAAMFSVILAVGILFVWYYSGQVLGLLNMSPRETGGFALSLFRRSLWFLLPLMGVGAVTAWFVNRLMFMSAHRMTRGEIEAEARDR